MPRIKRIGSIQDSDASSSVSSEEQLAEQFAVIKESFRRLKHENVTLREQKEALDAEMLSLRASTKQSPSRGGAPALRIKTLEKELAAAKKDAAKYKARYEKHKAVELKREQHELTEGFGHGTSTWEDKYRDMKRLLRSFRSLIEEIVLEDPDESGKYADCSVCYEELDKDSLPAAFPCEHVFHMECIRQLDRHAKEQQPTRRLSCPTCRKNWELGDVLDVNRTAGEQWADLTDVATEWANMEAQNDEGEEWISDKTSEPSFIENDMETAEDDVEEEGLGERMSESEENVAPQTPTRSQKRRRLEELAAARSGKKRKR